MASMWCAYARANQRFAFIGKYLVAEVVFLYGVRRARLAKQWPCNRREPVLGRGAVARTIRIAPEIQIGKRLAFFGNQGCSVFGVIRSSFIKKIRPVGISSHQQFRYPVNRIYALTCYLRFSFGRYFLQLH